MESLISAFQDFSFLLMSWLKAQYPIRKASNFSVICYFRVFRDLPLIISTDHTSTHRSVSEIKDLSLMDCKAIFSGIQWNP